MANSVAKLIAAFVMLIVGVSLISVVATQSNTVTDVGGASTAVDLSSARLAAGDINNTYVFTLNTHPSWRADYSECIPTTLEVTNASGFLLTATTDYTFTSATGALSFENSTDVRGSTNTTAAAYAYCQDTYMPLSWGRVALNTTMGLFAIGLMIGAVALGMSVFREYGIA